MVLEDLRMNIRTEPFRCIKRSYYHPELNYLVRMAVPA
jgi:hypothetical protein